MVIREITEADYPAIQALHRGVGWPERSLAGWRWLFEDPVRREVGAPAGWLVEGRDGVPAAHVGNMIQKFRLGDRILYGATGFSIIVDPAVRGASRQMIRAFVEQPRLFAAWTLNANSKSHRLYARHGMQAWPGPTHALKLGWPVDPFALLAARGLRHLVNAAPTLAPHIGERLMNGRLGRIPDLVLPPAVERLTDLRDRSPYADFWQALVAERRLLSDRSPETMRRRLADPDLTTPPLLLAYRRDGRVVGVALALLAKANIVEAPVLEIVDLEALDASPEAIPALMRALVDAARATGAAKVRLQVVSPRLLARLGPWAGRARREGGWGHSHVRFYEDGLADLWSPTPWDGDYALCLRPVPPSSRGATRASARLSAARPGSAAAVSRLLEASLRAKDKAFSSPGP